MSLKHGLLGLLSSCPMTGYQLDKKFKETLRYFWQAKTSQIYRELDAMEQKGWLTSERVIQDEKPNKRVYSITEEGRTVFRSWLSSHEAENTMSIKSSFLMRIFFARETGKEQTLDLLRSFRGECLALNKDMDALKEDFDRWESACGGSDEVMYRKLTALYGEIIGRARLEWAEKCINTLEATSVNPLLGDFRGKLS